jgi:hypothetical protein
MLHQIHSQKTAYSGIENIATAKAMLFNYLHYLARKKDPPALTDIVKHH